MYPITVSMVVGGTDYSSKVVSYKRKNNLCTPGQSITVELDPSYSYSIQPWQTFSLQENGTQVMTGYVSDFSLKRAPYSASLGAMDTWKRAVDTFIEDSVVTNGETVLYWIDYLCNLAGLSYVISAPTGSTLYVAQSIPLGLKSVADALTAMVNYTGWVIKVGADGVVNFVNIGTATDRTFYPVAGTRTQGDDDSRNGCIIWGLGVNYHATQAVNGTGSGRTMVLANPMIVSLDQANYIAQYLLNQFANLDDVLSIDVLGDPSIDTGQVANLSFQNSAYTNVITNVEATVDKTGYMMHVDLGRKCLSMVAVSPTQSVLYAGTSNYLARSYTFYTSGSPVWLNIWPYSSGSYGGLESFVTDTYSPISIGYSSGSFGIAVTTNLQNASPSWPITYTRAQFQSATGHPLWTVTNLSAAGASGLVYAQALDTSGSMYVGRSSNSGSTWVWSGAIDGIANDGVTRPYLGFATRGMGEIWTAGDAGRMWYCSSGSTGLSFVNTYTVSGATTPIRNIAVSDASHVYIGGGISGWWPYINPVYMGSYSLPSNVSNPDWMLGAPDGKYAGFAGTPSGGIINVNIPKGAVFSSGSIVCRFYTKTDTTATLQISALGVSGQNVSLSGTQRPTGWVYLNYYKPGNYAAFTLSDTTSGSIGVDSVEFQHQAGAISFSNGDLYQNGSPSGSWLGPLHWKFAANNYVSYATFYINNLYVGCTLDITVHCDYEQTTIPTPPYYLFFTDQATQSAFINGDSANAMQNGDTRTFSLTQVYDGSMGFKWQQGLSRKGEYEVTSIKIDGNEVLAIPGGIAYVKVSSGSSFNDITPSNGGASGYRGLASSANNSSSATALSSSGYLDWTSSTGSSWQVSPSTYSNGNNVSQNAWSYKKTYWLDDNGIYYSGDFMNTIQDKTGNWQATYGTTFALSGPKRILFATPTQ